MVVNYLKSMLKESPAEPASTLPAGDRRIEDWKNRTSDREGEGRDNWLEIPDPHGKGVDQYYETGEDRNERLHSLRETP